MLLPAPSKFLDGGLLRATGFMRASVPVLMHDVVMVKLSNVSNHRGVRLDTPLDPNLIVTPSQ